MNPISIDVVFDLGVKMRTEVLPVSREAINFRLLSTEMALTDAKKPIILKFKSLFFIRNIVKIEFTLYTGCTQCVTPKLSKKVLQIGDIALEKWDFLKKWFLKFFHGYFQEIRDNHR